MRNQCKGLASMLTLQQYQKAGEEHQVRFKFIYGLQDQWPIAASVGTMTIASEGEASSSLKFKGFRTLESWYIPVVGGGVLVSRTQPNC